MTDRTTAELRAPSSLEWLREIARDARGPLDVWLVEDPTGTLGNRGDLYPETITEAIAEAQHEAVLAVLEQLRVEVEDFAEPLGSEDPAFARGKDYAYNVVLAAIEKARGSGGQR
jgi:hypothetical protein